MKALLLERPGAPDTLKLGELPTPDPGAGELRVRVHAVGLNPVDYKLAARGVPAWAWPHVLGLDVAGVVDAVGPGVTAFAPGDRVYYHGDLRRPGGLAEYAVTTAHTVSKLPDELAFDHAAALPCAGFTAYQAIHQRLDVSKGMTVLVQAGAGGVGGFAVQLASRLGARVFTTCSNANLDYVKQLGAEVAIDRHSEDLAARVAELTEGLGVDAILDTLGAESATFGIARLLRFGGGIACVAGTPDLSKVPWGHAPSVHDLALGAAHASNDRAAQEALARMGDALARWAASGRISSTLDRVVPLADAAVSLSRLASGGGRGKTVVYV